MQCIIRYEQEQIGTMTVHREGLYERIEAVCKAMPGVFRLYLETERSADLLGVLAPENGALRLCRSFSAGKVPFSQDASVFLSQEEPWEPFSGQLFGIEVNGVRRRYVCGKTLYAETIEDRPLALLPFFSRCRAYRLYGKEALLLDAADEKEPPAE